MDIVTGEEKVERVGWTPETVEAWLRKQVYRLVSAEGRRMERLENLRSAAEKIPFPHPNYRPRQEEIGQAVATTIEDGSQLLLQAPTGTGKTAAVLHPAVKAALAKGKRVFFLTAKTLQQRLAVETLQAMQAEGLFRSLQLRAKGKMCANSETVCHEEFCPWAKEYGLKLIRTGLLPTMLEGSPHQDPDVIYETAFNHEVCPFEVSLDLLPDIDVVVCDYNYVFDPTIGLGALVDSHALTDAVLVIDETHNLVDRSRDYYSPILQRNEILRAVEFLKQRDHRVFDDLGRLCNELADYVADIVRGSFESGKHGDQVTNFDSEPLGKLRMALDGAMLQYFLYKREHDLWWAEDPVMDVFLALTRFHRVLSLGGDEFVHLARRDYTEGDSIKIFCRDASRFTGEVLKATAGVVAMSATLEPFEFYRDLLGFDPEATTELSVPSPFPESNRLIL
ncbi:MAG: DEAD/DEAH box helicase, partial [Acidobacteriota bacterium]